MFKVNNKNIKTGVFFVNFDYILPLDLAFLLLTLSRIIRAR